VSLAPPAISVAVCTRNRPDDLRECVATILANEGTPFELLVIDQSDGEGSRRTLGPAVDDPRVRYVATDTRGVSRSRNLAIEHARSETLLFTDDDCRVPPDWVANAWSVLQRDPQTAVACGRVRPPPGVPEGVIATFEPLTEEVFEGRYPSPMRPWGVTANMLVRRRVFEAIGGFDPLLGPGGELLCGEDTDLLLRALGAGYRVRETRAFEVTHLGVRTGREAGALFATYAVGTGAAYAKNARLRTPGATGLGVRLVVSTVAAIVKNVFIMGRPRGARFLLHLSRGAALSFRYRLDRREGCFMPNPPRSVAEGTE